MKVNEWRYDVHSEKKLGPAVAKAEISKEFGILNIFVISTSYINTLVNPGYLSRFRPTD